jgi:radical SAM superfamily enzyme YgiQ (UPF0313 family)
MKKALLINPWIYDFKGYDFWIKPAGLLKIAGLMKKNGADVHLIDCLYRTEPSKFGNGKYYYEEIVKPVVYKGIKRKYKRYGISVKTFYDKLKSVPSKPDVVLITSNMTYMYLGLIDTIKIVREVYGDVPIIVGGIYATLCHGHAVKSLGDVHVWQGNINNEFVRLINQLAGIQLPLMTELEVNELVPDYSFYPVLHAVAVQLTRGCPFNCTYCSVKQFYQGYYQRNIENVMFELGTYNRTGIKNVAFYDDALFYKNIFIKNVLNEIIDRKYEFYLHTPNGLHAAYIDEELAELMYKAGFVGFNVSLETTNSVLQTQTGGKVDNDKFKTAINNLENAGYKGSDIGVYMLVGLPGQTYEMILSDLNYLAGQNVKIKVLNYSPIPGTKEFSKLDRTIKDSLVDEPLLHNELYYMKINSGYTQEMHAHVKSVVAEHNNKLTG